MKILLVQPPTENMILGNNPEIIDEERGCNPPLGILYVAGYLQAHTNHEVQVMDCLVENVGHAGVEARIRDAAPDIVGITCLTFTLIDVLEVARAVKRVNDRIPVVVGGPHAHIYPKETAALNSIDYVVTGEGEVTMAELADAIARGDDPSSVPGIVFVRDGQVVATGARPPVHNLDELPFPARHLTPYRNYTSLLAKGTAVTTMFTSRGCPFGCKYCDRPNMGRMFRFRSPANVADEFQLCAEMGIDEFLVYDDTFSVSRKRALEICHKIIQRNLKVYWDIRTRVDLVNEELLLALKTAGCVRIHYGVEAGSDAILKNLNRGVTIDQVRKTFELTKKVGIGTLAYFMIGNPGEKREDVENTIRLAQELEPDFSHITILTPFPATQLYQEALASGMYKEDHWLKFARDPRPDFMPRFWEEHFTPEELMELCEMAYRRFYGRPSYAFRRLLQIRSPRELWRNLRAAYKLFLRPAQKRGSNSARLNAGTGDVPLDAGSSNT